MSRFSRRSFLRASGGVATLGALSGCLGGLTGGGDAITIGALEPISGPFAPWSTVHRDGLQYAVDEVNAAGGVLDRDLEVVVEDTGADAGQADSSFRRLVEQENAVATTGAVSSDVGLTVADTAADLEVPHLLHMSGTDDVITQDTQYIFRVGLLPASKYIEAQASAFADAGYTSVGAIVADYAWGRSAEAAINEFFDVDVQIEVAPPSPSTDFAPYVRQFPEDLEMLITSGHPPGTVGIANTAVDLGYTPEVITGSSAPPQLLSSGLNPGALERVVHIHNSNPYGEPFAEAASGFADEYDTQFNTHTAYGYATGHMLAAALETAGEADPTALANAVRDIEFDTLFAQPIQYNEYGELDQTVVIYSRVLAGETPSYDADGSYSYSELHRSESVSARVPGQ